ncbi:MAG: YkgJ family cysteine cluster protein [Betaproteobacteria bacterium]|nr:YkgJ family cysteine cluster protein [Betaproteobacteria bacterium]
MASKTIPIKPTYKCNKCPGFCCNYEHIPVHKRDLARLAKHFGVSLATAEQRYTKVIDGSLGMRHKKDHIYTSTCMLFDQKKRACTAYEGRPEVCRGYPDGPTCGYYNFLKFERRLQGDDEFIPDA